MTSYKFYYGLAKDKYAHKYILQSSSIYQDLYLNLNIPDNEFLTESLTIKVFCESMKDGLYYETSSYVTLYTQFKTGTEFSKTNEAMQINDKLNEIELINRAEALSSLVTPVYNYPYQMVNNSTKIAHTTDSSSLTLSEPICLPNFCFNQGKCLKVNEYLFCECWKGFAGINCQLTEENAAYIKQKSCNNI